MDTKKTKVFGIGAKVIVNTYRGHKLKGVIVNYECRLNNEEIYRIKGDYDFFYANSRDIFLRDEKK